MKGSKNNTWFICHQIHFQKSCDILLIDDKDKDVQCYFSALHKVYTCGVLKLGQVEE